MQQNFPIAEKCPAALCACPTYFFDLCQCFRVVSGRSKVVQKGSLEKLCKAPGLLDTNTSTRSMSTGNWASSYMAEIKARKYNISTRSSRQ